MRWALIPGYDGAYRVSDTGIVQSCHIKGKKKTRGSWWPMTLGLAREGYPLVYLWKGGRVRKLVHQLVAHAFVPHIDGKPDVNHLDGVKTNNYWRNLEWSTRAGNMLHAWRTGLCKPHKLTEEKVRSILSYPANDTETGKVFGVSQVWVTKIRARKAWKHV